MTNMIDRVRTWFERRARRARRLKEERDFALLNERKARRVPEQGLDLARARYFLARKQTSAAIEALKEEIRYFPDNAEARALLAGIDKPAEDPKAVSSDPEFLEIYEVARKYTMLWPKRLASLFERAKDVCARGVPGNFVECGVAAGGSSALLATVLSRKSKEPRKLFSCDTFEGMPAPTEADRHGTLDAMQVGWGAGTCAAPIDSLMEACRTLGVESYVEPLKGLFSETLPVHREHIGQIAFLHMDGDWYESTRDILLNLYDQVAVGGIIQIDDYGFWEGCRRAVTEFVEARNIKLDLHQIDETGVWFVKPAN